jgi:nucleoside-diphosphate-sugar epimerase
MITGGTGFVGWHTAQALLKAGHQVRLLVRDREKLKRLYGARVTDYVLGDITDPEAVRRALQGCDALVHTAAMVSVDLQDAERVMSTNLGGTRLVVGGAVELGLERIIHVSSVTALYNPEARFLNEYSPPGTAHDAYGRSKVESEIYVRELQDAGAPIHITYPASVIGPDDPGLTEPHQGLKSFLTNAVPILPSGNQWVDVRDVAFAHLALLERDLPAGRYPLGGHFVPWSKLVDTLGELTGRRMRNVPVPGAMMLGLGRLVDWFSKVSKKSPEMPVTHEAMVYATNWVRLDDSKTRTELEFAFRPFKETLTAAIGFLLEEGHIDATQAGKLCEQ